MLNSAYGAYVRLIRVPMRAISEHHHGNAPSLVAGAVQIWLLSRFVGRRACLHKARLDEITPALNLPVLQDLPCVLADLGLGNPLS